MQISRAIGRAKKCGVDQLCLGSSRKYCCASARQSGNCRRAGVRPKYRPPLYCHGADKHDMPRFADECDGSRLLSTLRPPAKEFVSPSSRNIGLRSW